MVACIPRVGSSSLETVEVLGLKDVSSLTVMARDNVGKFW